MTAPPLPVLAFLALSLLACDRTERPEFALVSVEPAVVSADRPTQVLLRGGFPALASTDLDDDEPPSIDRAWRVEVAGAALEGDAVTQRDRSTLEVDTPAGLPLGSHDVTVVSPRGDERTLSAGLTVSEDTTVDAGTNACAEVCTEGSCMGGTCVITCNGGCPNQITCPPGVPCEVQCQGQDACAGGVDCTASTACTVDCAGPSSCANEVLCGSGPCTVLCSGERSCENGVTCDASCRCEVTCSGDDACSDPAACPAGCESGAGCTASGSGCDAC